MIFEVIVAVFSDTHSSDTSYGLQRFRDSGTLAYRELSPLIRNAYNLHCRSCEEKVETLRQAALARTRLRSLVQQFFENFKEISGCRLGKLVHFTTGWP